MYFVRQGKMYVKDEAKVSSRVGGVKGMTDEV